VDHFCHTFDFVAVRIGQWIYNWWVYSYPPSDRHRRSVNPNNPGTESIVVILIDRLRKENEPMKPIMILGIVLIIIGAIALGYHGITYTTREKVLKIGPIEATRETEKTIPLPPILGGLVLVGGIVLVILGARKS
jgi:hypothetical protein